MVKKLFIAFALLAITLGSAAIIAVPSVRARAESIPQRLETWWHERQPHDLYVPPPVEVLSPVSQVPSPQATKPPADQVPSHPNDQPTARPTTQLPNNPTTQPTNQPTTQPPIKVTPAPAEVHLTNVRHEYQGWNNCGPTTVAMLLSHYGYSDTQNQTAPILKPNPNDKNVGPDELAAYVRTKPNLDALTLINGNEQMLKQLIANGFPVIVETWFTPKPNDGMGHYRLLVGYSDTQKKFSALDSYNGPNVTLGYDDFDADWKAFNRTLVIGFPRAQSPVVNAITGYANDEALWRIAAERASAEIAANGNDAFAWYNLGSSQSALGQHESATKAFDRARRIGLPWRMLWYQFAIFDTYLAVGRTQDVLDLTTVNLKQASDLEESHYYRGRALEALGKNDEAIKEYREALRLNKNYEAAAKALRSVGG